MPPKTVRTSRLRATFLFSVCLFLAAESNVFGYTDPGSGTILWQIFVAGSVGLLYSFHKILDWFRFKSRGKPK